MTNQPPLEPSEQDPGEAEGRDHVVAPEKVRKWAPKDLARKLQVPSKLHGAETLISKE